MRYFRPKGEWFRAVRRNSPSAGCGKPWFSGRGTLCWRGSDEMGAGAVLRHEGVRSVSASLALARRCADLFYFYFYGKDRVSHTSSPPSSAETWSRWNPSFSRTRNDAVFQGRTVDQSRSRPVATAASSTADAASVA